MAAPAGWHPDPYGRFAKRYWNGERWTEHVVDGASHQQVDPMGTSTVIPFVLPETATGDKNDGRNDGDGDDGDGDDGDDHPQPQTPAFAGVGTPPPNPPGPPPAAPAPSSPPPPGSTPRFTTRGGAPRGGIALLDWMAPDSRERPRPLISTAIAGLGGAMLGAGVLALVARDERGTLAVGGGLVVVIAAVLRLATRTNLLTRAVAVGAGAVGLYALSFGLAGDRPHPTTLALIITVAFGLAWMLPGFHGRPLMLGIAAQALAAAIVYTVAGEDSWRARRFPSDPIIGLGAPRDAAAGYTGLIIGAALLFAVWFLDRRRYHGTATALVPAALVTTASGTAILATRFGANSPIAAVLVGVVGAATAYVGSHGDRRLTTWVGAAVTALGVGWFVARVFQPRTPKDGGMVALLAGGLLVAGALLARALRNRELLDGGRPDINRPE